MKNEIMIIVVYDVSDLHPRCIMSSLMLPWIDHLRLGLSSIMGNDR